MGRPYMQESWSQENYNVMLWAGVRFQPQVSAVEYQCLSYWPDTTVLLSNSKRFFYLLDNSQATSSLCSSGLLVFILLVTQRPDLNWEDYKCVYQRYSLIPWFPAFSWKLEGRDWNLCKMSWTEKLSSFFMWTSDQQIIMQRRKDTPTLRAGKVGNIQWVDSGHVWPGMAVRCVLPPRHFFSRMREPSSLIPPTPNASAPDLNHIGRHTLHSVPFISADKPKTGHSILNVI